MGPGIKIRRLDALRAQDGPDVGAMLAAVHDELRNNRGRRPLAVVKLHHRARLWQRIHEGSPRPGGLVSQLPQSGQVSVIRASWKLYAWKGHEMLVVAPFALKQMLQRLAHAAIHSSRRRIQYLVGVSAKELEQSPVRPTVVFDEAVEVGGHGSECSRSASLIGKLARLER